MTDTLMAVVYAAKSTEDKHGSIPTQIEDCRALAAREEWEVVGTYVDEAKSAFHGNRGDDLARARAHAERIGGVIVVQHSDRLARGDGIKADHLVELVLWAMKAGVTLASDQDPQTFGMGLVYAALMGDRNHDDSARKSAAVKSGLGRRKARGAPVGPVPLGYRVESTVLDGEHVLTSRVVDPPTAALVERIFDMVEAGATFGDVARALNAAGFVGRRGKPWVSRTARTIVHNAAYKGAKGYPAIIDADRWDRIHDGLQRLDPAAVKRRQGGRKPADDSFILRGLAFCRCCGGTLYTRRQAVGRVYVCRNRREGTGLCSAAVIPAPLIEGHVLRHLDLFIFDVETWIDEQLQQRGTDQQAREAVVEHERGALAALDRQREQHMAEYRRLVADGDRLARYALEEVERIDCQREEQEHVIAQAQSVVSEWQGPPDMDAALDFYRSIVDLVEGRVRTARGAPELNQALHRVVAGLWAEVDGDRLHAEFSLRPPDEVDGQVHGLLHAMHSDRDLRGRRVSFSTTEYPGNPKETELVEASLAARKPGATPRSIAA